jgi:hypothetical protein
MTLIPKTIFDCSKEEVRNKLDKIIKYRCKQKCRSSSYVTIDIPNTDKQIFYLASCKGLYVAIYHGTWNGLYFKQVNLFTNKRSISFMTKAS